MKPPLHFEITQSPMVSLYHNLGLHLLLSPHLGSGSSVASVLLRSINEDGFSPNLSAIWDDAVFLQENSPVLLWPPMP